MCSLFFDVKGFFDKIFFMFSYYSNELIVLMEGRLLIVLSDVHARNSKRVNKSLSSLTDSFHCSLFYRYYMLQGRIKKSIIRGFMSCDMALAPTTRLIFFL